MRAAPSANYLHAVRVGKHVGLNIIKFKKQKVVVDTIDRRENGLVLIKRLGGVSGVEGVEHRLVAREAGGDGVHALRVGRAGRAARQEGLGTTWGERGHCTRGGGIRRDVE